MHERACAQIFWEDLGEENRLQQREVEDKAVSVFLCALRCNNYGKRPAQPALAQEALVSLRLCHGERKEDPSVP